MVFNSALLPICGSAPFAVDAIFIETASPIFEKPYRQLLKCWLNKHFAFGHPSCSEQFEIRLEENLLLALSKKMNSEWHLRFVNGFQLINECDTAAKRILCNPKLVIYIVEYFTMILSDFSNRKITEGEGLAYVEAKVLLKSVQIFSRIFGKIENARDVKIPNEMMDHLWILVVGDSFELDLRQASTNLILQLHPTMHYDVFNKRVQDISREIINIDRIEDTMACVNMLAVGAFCSQVNSKQMIEFLPGRQHILLIVLLQDLSSCCLSR